MRGYQTVEEWEARLGEQLRDVRVARALDQVGLAELANVSVRAVSNLERGRGSSLKTLVAVAKALERTDWLDALAPPVTISPIQMLRAKTRTQGRRVRVRTGRSEV
ncbi:MAG TPA: helix-turn-helix transcriptional regulator [Acidothermaceae bacterium]